MVQTNQEFRSTERTTRRKTQPIEGLTLKREMLHDHDPEVLQLIFGFDVTRVGTRFLRAWIVEHVQEEEIAAGAQIGYLCVKTHDTGDTPQDLAAKGLPNFVGTATDKNDPRVRYYYFRPSQ